MPKRLGLLVAAIFLGFMVAAAAATTLRITSFSAGPSTGRETLGQVKGTARFRIAGDRNDRTLEAYGNGNGAGQYQCVELIKRYGSALGLPNFPRNKLPAVDQLAGTDRWVRGNAETIALLKAQSFDFKSRDAGELVRSGIQLNSWPPGLAGANEVIQAAIAEGLDLSTPVDVGVRGRSNESATIGSVIAHYAAETGNEALFEEMLRKGQVARMGKKSLDTAFLGDMGVQLPHCQSSRRCWSKSDGSWRKWKRTACAPEQLRTM